MRIFFHDDAQVPRQPVTILIGWTEACNYQRGKPQVKARFPPILINRGYFFAAVAKRPVDCSSSNRTFTDSFRSSKLTASVS